jgi:putative SOS response-associated peptidase YedK
MCNLYRMTKAPDEVARWFKADIGRIGNAANEVYPGYPGFVIANGELRSMVWGFPFTPRA